MIFVFGSNLSGRHGAGAAKFALNNHGAIYGKAIGLMGNSYAIPTKDQNFKSLPLHIIGEFVEEFKEFASSNPTLTFQLTRIGCGLAGYHDSDIIPLFGDGLAKNILIPSEWIGAFQNESWGSYDDK